MVSMHSIVVFYSSETVLVCFLLQHSLMKLLVFEEADGNWMWMISMIWKKTRTEFRKIELLWDLTNEENRAFTHLVTKTGNVFSAGRSTLIATLRIRNANANYASRNMRAVLNMVRQLKLSWMLCYKHNLIMSSHHRSASKAKYTIDKVRVCVCNRR